jgi:hypothetical protein
MKGVAVRFGELRGLTSLPIRALREQFRYEEVLTVLPVQDGVTGRETLLVATRTMLALLTALRVPRGHWMTRWAPWDTVAIADPAAPPGQDDDVFRLTVLVGGQMFHAQLRGEPGRKALRDFVVAVRTMRPKKAARR